mmetsp:Transcript_24973/g.63003  ORF Transcript_24973/g.63003 Transcript_24973/m.63003 type:complete len:291 (-) Transcript_24973:205-1077(-)
MEESVYSLIPEPYMPPPKKPLYRSNFNEAPAHPKKPAATFGQPHTNVDAKQFLKKGQSAVPTLRNPVAVGVTRRNTAPMKAGVPNRNDKPVMGLVSQKNFVTANAVDNILAVPPPRPAGEVNYLEKEDYGQVPTYLDGVKKQIHDEYELIRMIEEEANKEELEHVEMLSEQERKGLLDGLKQTWEMINREYQGLSFTLDTESKKKRKEECEQKLTQIEKDIGFLSKKFVFLTPDPHPDGLGRGARGSQGRSPQKSVSPHSKVSGGSPSKHFSPASSPVMSQAMSPSPAKH